MQDIGQNFLKSIVTGDETWCSKYESETNLPSAEWRAPNEGIPRKKSLGEVKSEGYADLFLRFKRNYPQRTCSTQLVTRAP